MVTSYWQVLPLYGSGKLIKLLESSFLGGAQLHSFQTAFQHAKTSQKSALNICDINAEFIGLSREGH